VDEPGRRRPHVRVAPSEPRARVVKRSSCRLGVDEPGRRRPHVRVAACQPISGAKQRPSGIALRMISLTISEFPAM